jgi:UDP-glucose 4-epimerase
MKRRVLITGSSGLAGGALVRRFEKANKEKAGTGNGYLVFGADIIPPKYNENGFFSYYPLDVRSLRLVDFIRDKGIDTVVHLAWWLKPARTKQQQQEEIDTDINGTINVLNACEKVGVGNLIYTSTSKHYSHEVEVPWIETDFLEKADNFGGYIYGRDKVIVEGVIDEYRNKHKDKRIVVLRPGHIWGPNVDNRLSQRFSKDRFVFGIKGYNPWRAFIHEDDLADIIYKAVQDDSIQGIFNVSAGSIKHSELAKASLDILGKKSLYVSDSLARFSSKLFWDLRISDIEPSQLFQVKRDIILNTEKADSSFGKTRYTVKETFISFLEAAKKRKNSKKDSRCISGYLASLVYKVPEKLNDFFSPEIE